MDILHEVLKFADHNRGIIACIGVVGGALAYSGCSTTTIDPSTGKSVSRTQLVMSAEAFQATFNTSVEQLRDDYERNVTIARRAFGDRVGAYELAEADLDAKDEQKEKLLGVISSVSSLNPATAGIMTIAGPLLAGGLGLDNWRKGKRIRKLSNGHPPPTV
jgi:hypothetical protein